jgi:hypothetical protein
MDIRAQLKAALFGQESSSGAADTTGVNYAGATGPMQITKGTWAGMQQAGMIPADWTQDSSTPEGKARGMEAGSRLVDHLMTQFGDDPRKAAAAYYAGPKAIDSDGNIVDFHDLKNPKAPTTLQYVSQIAARMGLDGSVPVSTGAGSSVITGQQGARPTLDNWSSTPAPDHGRPSMDNWLDTPAPDRSGHNKGTKPLDMPLEPMNAAPNPNGTPVAAALEAETKANQSKSDNYNSGGVLDSAQHQFAWAGVGGIITRWLGSDNPYPAVPGYNPSVVDKDLYAGKSEADQQLLDEATSPRHAQWLNMQIEQRNDDMLAAQKQGTGTAIMGGLLGGVPEGWATGFGITKAFTLAKQIKATVATARAIEAAKAVGPNLPGVVDAAGAAARAAAKAGPTTRVGAIASNFGEQLIGNLGSVAVQAQFYPYVSKEDGFMAVGMSTLFAGIHGATWHPSDAVYARTLGQSIMDDSANRQIETRAQALKNLGPEASPEALQAEVRRLEASSVNDTIQSGKATVPENRRLIPDTDAIVHEETAKAAETEAAAAPAPEPAKPAKPETVPGTTVPVNEEPTKYVPLGTTSGPILPDGLKDAKPRYSFGRKGFGLYFASDVDRAAFIAAQKKPSKADMKYVKWVSEQTGMSEAEVRAHGQAVREQIKEQARTTNPADAPTLRVEALTRGEKPAVSSDMSGEHTFDSGLKQSEPWLNGDRSEARQRAGAKAFPEAVKGMTEGRTLEEVDALGKGVHVTDNVAAEAGHKPAVDALRWLQKKYLPDSIIHIAHLTEDNKARGKVGSFGKTHTIGLREDLPPTQAILTAVHEFGHAVFHETAKDIPADLLDWLGHEHGVFLGKLARGEASARFARYAEGSDHSVSSKPIPITEYAKSFDEYTAEAFVRHIQKAAREAGITDMPKGVQSMLKAVWEKIKGLYEDLFKAKLLPKDEAFGEYFNRVLTGTLKDDPRMLVPEATEARFEDIPEFATSHDLSEDIGADLLPEATIQQRAEKRIVTEIHARANAWAKNTTVETKRLSKLLKNTVFDPASSVMLRSTNAVVRMVSAELLENGGGAGGRRSTAALGKWLHEREYMGNTINDVQKAYVEWRNLQNGSTWGDFRDGNLRRQFDRMVAEETESRNQGRATTSPEQVVRAADIFEAAYERTRQGQLKAKTVGWASLPETSKGYMPHRMSRDAIINITGEQTRALWQALVDQFINIEGYDASFSANLASKYIDRVKRAALGGYDAPVGVHQTGAADIVEDALTAMGLNKMEVRAMMQRYMAGGPGHTKRRLKLDLLADHPDGTGGTFKLMDLFETDQLKLLRSQVDRVSGEVALAQHGVMGKPGLALLRRAMEFGADGQHATGDELRAFDQVSAEFLGAPFGTAAGKWADRAMQFNSLARLGGMGFQQLGETINGFFHVGVGRTMEAVAGIPRLRAEAIKLAKGEHVDNPLLSSIETFGGAEFGTDAYKMVFPFDEGQNEFRVYGKDSLHFADRVLRGGTALQSKLSFWRAINGAQYRGMAEQIVLKSMRLIREGGHDIALDDMGIHAELRAKLLAELPNIAQFDATGRVSRLDITKIKDTAAGTEYVQAVHRGVGQIIQNERIGEKGYYAHNGFMRLLTQFRTFSITSVEKQWARQVGNHGTAKAFGMMMGAMSVAAPIFIARTYINSAGRKDREAYLAQQLTAFNIAKSTLNYISMSGLAGDFLDATSAVTGLGGQSTGGRAGAGKSFIGNTIAPAAGLANDLYEGIQNTKDGTDPHQLAKSLPFSRLPFLVPAIDALTGH